jgi:hypothetical protein
LALTAASTAITSKCVGARNIQSERFRTLTKKHGASTDFFNRCTWYLIPSSMFSFDTTLDHLPPSEVAKLRRFAIVAQIGKIQPIVGLAPILADPVAVNVLARRKHRFGDRANLVRRRAASAEPIEARTD